jgi:hypothetical protein
MGDWGQSRISDSALIRGRQGRGSSFFFAGEMGKRSERERERESDVKIKR